MSSSILFLVFPFVGVALVNLWLTRFHNIPSQKGGCEFVLEADSFVRWQKHFGDDCHLSDPNEKRSCLTYHPGYMVHWWVLVHFGPFLPPLARPRPVPTPPKKKERTKEGKKNRSPLDCHSPYPCTLFTTLLFLYCFHSFPKT